MAYYKCISSSNRFQSTVERAEDNVYCIITSPSFSLGLTVPVDLLYLASRQGQEGRTNYALVQ